MVPTLYPHQETFVDELRASLQRHRNSIACACTGFGKSRLAKWILARTLAHEPTPRQSGYAMFTVHRRGLVDNIRQVLQQDPAVPHGVLMSGEDTDHEQRIQVASIDTLLSWYCEGGGYALERTYDIVVIDECHSHHSKYVTFLEAHNARRETLGLSMPYVLGLSATPEAKGLADVYRHIVQGPTPQWLQENGYAAKFSYMAGRKGDLSKLKRMGGTGEFTKDSVSEAMYGLEGEFVRDWVKHASGMPTIGFFPRCEYAREAQRRLREADIDARYVDGETPDEDRRNLYRGLNEGVYPYLCNVGVVERGTDIPAIRCVQLCTAIGSRVRYLQMIGRGARVTPNKSECLVLDHGANVKRHGFWEDEIAWTLDVTSKPVREQEVRPTLECPSCGAVYRGGACKKCGYEPTHQERRKQGFTFDGGELVEITRKSQQKIVDPKYLFVNCLYRAGRSGRTWKQAVGLYYREADRLKLPRRVPKSFSIGNRYCESIKFGDPQGMRKVSELFPFMR